MTTAFDSKSYIPTAADIRRRTCVVCGVATPNSYVTSFTRVPERQEEWVSLLANGDLDYSVDLKGKLAQGRKYLCLDHFDRHQLTTRKNGDGIEILRNSCPMPFKNAEFTRKHHDEILNLPPSLTHVNTDPIPEKRQKLPSESEHKTAQPTGTSMALLMNTVNFYVEQSMNAASLAKKKAMEEMS